MFPGPGTANANVTDEMPLAAVAELSRLQREQAECLLMLG
jgi:hypothetical protein